MKTIHITLAKQYRKLALRPSMLANYVSHKFNNSPRRVLYYAGRYHYNDIFKPHNSTLRIIILFLTLAFCYSTFLSGRVAVAESTTFTINNNNTVLELTVPSSINLELNPTTGTDFSTVNLPISVGTNNRTGYTLSMAASSATLTRTGSITDGNDNVSTPTIEPILTTVSPTGYDISQFASSTTNTYTLNRWGYKLSTSTNYLPMTTSLIQLSKTWGMSNINTTTIDLAAKVDTTIPAGAYRTTINFTAVTNPVPLTINDLEYMQDFASFTQDEKTEVIDSMTEGTSYTLYDSRDNTSYNVAKLKDGNVWMRDNLTLDLTDSTVQANLTSFTTNASDQSISCLKTGQYNGETCSGPHTAYAVDISTSANYRNRPTIAKSGNCSNNYCVDNPESGKWTYDSITQTIINGTTSRAQGKIGIYYNYCAASAGSYCKSPNDIAEDICPISWSLPTGGNNGQFQTLYTAYSANATNFQQALSTPLSGYFTNALAYNQGSYGYFWSSTAYDATRMYILTVGSTSVGPQYYSNGYPALGFSIRCVLR